MCLQIIYIWYMYKEDLALNNQQGLIYHKTHQTISTKSTKLQKKTWNSHGCQTNFYNSHWLSLT